MSSPAPSLRRRSHWGWGWSDLEPSVDDQTALATQVHALTGWEGLLPTAPPPPQSVQLPDPRIFAPDELAPITSADPPDRARHSYGRSYRDVARAFANRYDHPIDLVMRPRNDAEIEACFEFAANTGAAIVPYGGGSSVVGGVNPAFDRPSISLDLEELSGLFELDALSLAARFGGGTLGPEVNRLLGAHDLCLRHFPQSYEFSTVGGWIATRAGGHYAMGRTHIDDFVESTRMVTPSGVWESRRLPGSGAGPSPDRLVLGSEGTLGVVADAWLRVQQRPKFRGSASFQFDSVSTATAAVRALAQSDLTPSNCRLLDATEAMVNGVGTQPVLILGFESADHPLGPWLDRGSAIVADHGGVLTEGSRSLRSPTDDERSPIPQTTGSESTWRRAFIAAPYRRDAMIALGAIAETFETACTWDRFNDLHHAVVEEIGAVGRELGVGLVASMRFTHVYPDGPAPYYTVLGAPPSTDNADLAARSRAMISAWDDVKAAVSEVLATRGATITHHHAIGRDHLPWYQRQRPDLFAAAFGAAKAVCDPQGILNPGVLIEPK
jgi:alkyldihydroxyacetonephosphate synthase